MILFKKVRYLRKSGIISNIQLKRCSDNWIVDDELKIDVDSYIIYSFKIAQITEKKLDMDLFYRVMRHEISEALCDSTTALPASYFKLDGALSEEGYNYFNALHQALAKILAEEIWPEFLAQHSIKQC